MRAQEESVEAAAHAATRERIMQWADGAALLQAAAAAIALGLIEPLAQGRSSVGELARRCACHAPSLRRLLRALAGAGLVVFIA